MTRAARWIAAIGLGWAASAASAVVPYTPQDDGVVLEQLRRPRLAGMASLQELRQRQAAQPNHVPSALAYARAALELSRREEDPRYLGHAQAALAPWWDMPRPPPEVALLRASLRLARMEVAPAERDLQLLIDSATTESHAARLTRAGLRLSQGDPVAAAADCQAAAAHVGVLTGATCLAAAHGLQGDSTGALARLDAVMRDSAGVPWAGELWARAVAAELAQRGGQLVLARRHFEAGLQRMSAAEATDPALLAAYADFLLEQGDGAKVRQLLSDYRRQDSLLLRLTLAEQRAGQAGDTAAASSARQQLQYLVLRFAEMRQRGDRSHLRDEALMELELRANPAAALTLITQSWAFQRDPVDARLYLRAARLSGQAVKAQAVAAWIAATGVRDLRLEPELALWRQQIGTR